jgi:hypothetical protein
LIFVAGIDVNQNPTTPLVAVRKYASNYFPKGNPPANDDRRDTRNTHNDTTVSYS